MELSIIVPVYNMAADDKLKHCMDSLIAQTVDEYEIIAVDDASTDESLKVLRSYEKKYPGIVKVIACKENQRQGGAKNAGLEQASGKWVGFIDSDDWIMPDMYQKLIKKADATGADLVGCDYAIVTSYCEPDKIKQTQMQVVENNTQQQTGVLDEEKHKKLILRSGSMVVKIYLRQIIEENHLRFPERMFYEDNCAAPLWSMYFTHFERVEEPLYFYLTLSASTTHHVTWDKCQDRMKAAKLLLEESRARGFFQQYQKEIEFRFTELFYVTTLFSYMYSGKRQSIKHTRWLKKQMLEAVDRFWENPYYTSMVAAEDQKFIRIQMKSNVIFFLYYRLLFAYRKLRKGVR